MLRFVMYSEVGYELVLGTTWFWYELVVGTSWLGYELAWYDLVRVRVDWKPPIGMYAVVLVSFDNLFFSPCHDMHLSFLSAKIYTACVQIFFSERVINCWNSLPDSVDFSSFTTFRRTVKQVDFSRILLMLCRRRRRRRGNSGSDK